MDTPIKTVVEGKLYEADGKMYVPWDVDLSRCGNRKINVDGWGNTAHLSNALTCRNQTRI